MLGELFDPKAELLIQERLRPHWAQSGAVVFVTFRTADSIPKEVVVRWDREKRDWIERALKRRGVPVKPICGNDTSSHVDYTREKSNEESTLTRLRLLLNEEERREFDSHFNHCREVTLDECMGACVLKQPEISQIVSDSLLHFDGTRYRMGDFVIMPNHVHLLAAFATPESMMKQFDSWLHFTAFRINRTIGRHGRFWQPEPFDHLVRTLEQYEYLRTYIAENPMKARLLKGEYCYRRYVE